MRDFIINIASKFGLEESLAEKAVGIFMSLIKSNAEEGTVSQLFDKLPGASDLAEKYAGDATGESDDSLMGKLGGMLGGDMGAAMSAVGALKATGLDMGQIKDIGKDIFSHAKENAGNDLAKDVIQQVAGNIPGLDKLI